MKKRLGACFFKYKHTQTICRNTQDHFVGLLKGLRIVALLTFSMPNRNQISKKSFNETRIVRPRTCSKLSKKSPTEYNNFARVYSFYTLNKLLATGEKDVNIARMQQDVSKDKNRTTY